MIPDNLNPSFWEAFDLTNTKARPIDSPDQGMP